MDSVNVRVVVAALVVSVAACVGYLAGERDTTVQIVVPEPTTTAPRVAP